MSKNLNQSLFHTQTQQVVLLFLSMIFMRLLLVLRLNSNTDNALNAQHESIIVINVTLMNLLFIKLIAQIVKLGMYLSKQPTITLVFKLHVCRSIHLVSALNVLVHGS